VLPQQRNTDPGVLQQQESIRNALTSNVADVADVAQQGRGNGLANEGKLRHTHRCSECGKEGFPPAPVAEWPHTGCGGTWEPLEEAQQHE
jgi:hypothetical protein